MLMCFSGDGWKKQVTWYIGKRRLLSDHNNWGEAEVIITCYWCWVMFLCNWIINQKVNRRALSWIRRQVIHSIWSGTLLPDKLFAYRHLKSKIFIKIAKNHRNWLKNVSPLALKFGHLEKQYSLVLYRMYSIMKGTKSKAQPQEGAWDTIKYLAFWRDWLSRVWFFVDTCWNNIVI